MTPVTNLTNSQLVQWYIDNREYIKEQTKHYDNIVDPIKETQEQIEDELRRRLNELEANSMNTDAGSIVTSKRTVYSVEDKKAFGEYIVETGDYEATQLRASKEAIEAYRLKNDGNLPPGLSVTTIATLSIRKPR